MNVRNPIKIMKKANRKKKIKPKLKELKNLKTKHHR
jgi:hypothetical protein